MKFHSFDIVSMVLDVANERFAPFFSPVEERVKILRQYCGEIDKLLEERDGEEFECEIDENDHTVHIGFTVMDIVADNPKTDSFPQLVSRANSVEILPAGEETIRIRFVFPSLWEKA